MKIAIASGKGGTGKTTLSINLAELIAENTKVVLVDLDVEEPNTGLFFSGNLIFEEIKYKLIPQWEEDTCVLCGNCENVCNFNAVIKFNKEIMVFPQLCHSCHACSELCPTQSLPMNKQRIGKLKHLKNGNIDFIESRLDIGEEQAVPIISQTIDYIEEHFDNEIIIMDSPPGASCPVIEVAKNADFIILVTEPTPFGLHDLIIAIETMQDLKKDFAIVINRHGIGNDEVERYCKKNNIPLIAKIPNDRKIAELYSKGSLIYTEFPEVKTELEAKMQWLFLKRSLIKLQKMVKDSLLG